MNVAAIACVGLNATWAIGGGPEYERVRDVVYGRKHGMALTLDVIRPRSGGNGVGLLYIAGGGFFSSPEMIQPPIFEPLVARGYTVFAVVHSCQPRFQVDEIIADVNRAARFVRSRAREYAIDPDRLGAYGGSAGGHLALMLGTAGTPGNPAADDPVERASSKVQAVACFFPPTDALNWGAPGVERIRSTDYEPSIRGAFDFREQDPVSNLWVSITDETKLRAKARAISPIQHVTADDAPTLIVHGDADEAVPLQQSTTFQAKLNEAGVPNELIVRPGMNHGLTTLEQDLNRFADWFDKRLR